jgi:hypothetical protein
MTKASSPPALPKAILIWLNERVPVPIQVWGIVLYFTCAATASWGQIGTWSFRSVDILGALAALSIFVLIRIADEHKDYEDDNQNHPERPVQRGIITLAQLRGLAVGIIGFQLIASGIADQGIGRTVLAWFGLMIWLGLMTKEFFIHKWLKTQLLIYAVSHMLIMPLIGWWLLQFGVPQVTPALSSGAWIMLALFLSGFEGEIVRKTWGPDEEMDGVDSYSKIFGARGSICVAMALHALLTGTLVALLGKITGAWINTYTLLMTVAGGLAYAAFLAYFRKPSTKGRKLNELAVGLTVLFGFFLIILAIARS